MILQYLRIEVDKSKVGDTKYGLFSFKKREEEMQHKREEEQNQQKLKFHEIVQRVRG